MTRHKMYELFKLEQPPRVCAECGRHMPLVTLEMKPQKIPLCRYCRAKHPKTWEQVKYLIEGDK